MKPMYGKQRWPGLWPGLILVSLGGGLLAREFGYLPAHVRALDFWPLLVVFIGISSLTRARSVVGASFALAFTGLGGVLLASNFGVLTFPAARLWPALLVLLGLAVLLSGGRRRALAPPRSDPPAGGRGSAQPWRDASGEAPRDAASNCGPQTTDADRLTKQLMFSGAQWKIESQAWQGGELSVTGGGVELDLRYAHLAPEGAVLDLRILMGGVDIRVPDTWQVQCDISPLFGGADDTTRSTQGATNAPRLRVTGSVTLGGVNIRN